MADDATIKGNNVEEFVVDYSTKKESLFPSPIAGQENSKEFIITYTTKAEVTIAEENEKLFEIYVWEPIPIKEARQFFEGIYLVRWNEYNETPLAEFKRYELHRSTSTFTPAPGDPTKVFESTTATDTHFFDDTGDAVTEFFYRVITLLDDGRYSLSPEVTGNRIPTFAAWPDALIHNNDGDAVSRDGTYSCECEVATDPDGHSIEYYFQYTLIAGTPEFLLGWSFLFGPDSDPFNRYIQVENRKIITSGGYGVWVNSVLWTYAGDEVSDLSGYGPTDEVYVYDPIHDFLIFGDGTNGKIPSYGDTIEVDYSNWNDINTATALDQIVQIWDVGLTGPGIFDMRVYACDPAYPTTIKSYVDVSEVTFSIVATLPPTLVYPINDEIIHTFTPLFQFYGFSYLGGSLKYKFQVANDIDFTSIVQEFNQVTTPSEWGDPQYPDGQMVDFGTPTTKLIHPNGTFYWRAASYDLGFAAWSGWSTVGTFTIEGATYQWKVGESGSEVDFLPKKGGWEVEVVQVGREDAEKRIFRVTFAPMLESKMLELKAEFDKGIILLLWDNDGVSWQVWWGESERTLSGKAHPPGTPVFGIKEINYIPGVRRWGGTSVFTEV